MANRQSNAISQIFTLHISLTAQPILMKLETWNYYLKTTNHANCISCLLLHPNVIKKNRLGKIIVSFKDLFDVSLEIMLNHWWHHLLMLHACETWGWPLATEQINNNHNVCCCSRRSWTASTCIFSSFSTYRLWWYHHNILPQFYCAKWTYFKICPLINCKLRRFGSLMTNT